MDGVSPSPRPPHVPDAAAGAVVVGLEARRMARLARTAVGRLRALRARRERGELSDEDYRHAVSAELEAGQSPSPGDAA